MKKIAVIIGIAIVGSCAAVPRQPDSSDIPAFVPGRDLGVVTYYDRNSDGIVDLEFHDFGCCDRNWALVDTQFSGRYNVKVKWGYSLTTESTNVPVPSDVKIKTDQSKMPSW